MGGFARIPGRPQPAIPEAPADNEAWGRENAGWVRVVAVSGDTMTGPLTLAADPVTNLEATTKQYVDAVQSLCVLKTGDTMTGALVLPATDPVADDEATRKLYVDTADAALQLQIDTLSAGLIYVGAYDVLLDDAIFTPASGLTNGPLPPANAPGIEAGWYVICTSTGTGTGNAPPVILRAGDQLISAGPTGGPDWFVLLVGGQASTTADLVALNPQVAGWANVQQAVEGLIRPDGTVSMTGNLNFNDGLGMTVSGGGRFYKAAGAGVIIRESSGGQQPQIEDNNGGNRRDIIDTQNGDARYLTPAAGNARYVDQVGDTMTGALYMANAQIASRSSGTTGEGPGIYFQNSAGSNAVQLSANVTGLWSGSVPETKFIVRTNNGGYGWQNFFESQVGGPPTLYCFGPCSASNIINRSDLALKQDISEPGAAEFASAFANLKPKKFRRKPAPPGEGASLSMPVGRWEYGLIAQEVEQGAPGAIVTDQDGIKGYSVTDVLAIAIAKIRELETEIQRLKQR